MRTTHEKQREIDDHKMNYQKVYKELLYTQERLHEREQELAECKKKERMKEQEWKETEGGYQKIMRTQRDKMADMQQSLEDC